MSENRLQFVFQNRNSLQGHLVTEKEIQLGGKLVDLQSTNFLVTAYFTQGYGIRKLVYLPMIFLRCFYAKLIALKSIFSN